MRLLIATPLYPPDPGGPATYARILEEQLPGEGIEVSLVKFGQVRHLPKVVRHLAYFWNILRAAKDADVVLALDPVSTGLPARLAALMRRKPFLVKVVGDYAWEQGRQRFGVASSLDTFIHERNVPPQVSLLRFVQSAVAKSATAVIVPSSYLKRVVCVWGVSQERITVIYNAVLPEEPTGIPESIASLNRPRIVTAGRLVPWKGMGGVIDAVERLRAELPELSLIVVGDGPDRTHLEAYARARLESGYVFTGTLPHQEALAIIGDANLFVLNSTYEGLSHLLIEALSLGTVTVATEVGGNPELIAHEENGLLVPVREPGRLVAACQRALDDGTLRTKLSAAAVASMERFSMEAMTQQTAKLIHSLP